MIIEVINYYLVKINYIPPPYIFKAFIPKTIYIVEQRRGQYSPLKDQVFKVFACFYETQPTKVNSCN